MIQLENELDGERARFERQLLRILKAAGLHAKAGLGRRRGGAGGAGDRALLASRSKSSDDRDRDRDGDVGEGDVDFVVELFRQQQDEERLKVMALKSVLLQFSSKLSE